MRSTENNKDGRLAILILSQNLECDNLMDELNSQNKAAILRLRYKGETRSWGIVKYVNAHKQQHHAQAQLHNDHSFNDFEDREKVTMLINEIKTG